TSHGLFLELKNKQNLTNQSLKTTFFQNPDFIRFKLIFERSNMPMNNHQILDLILEGTWNQFKNIWDVEEISSNSYLELRRKILTNYLSNGSK
ncbi:hypothetical protein ABTN61_19550, partial [Acinetobacter baumannii]